MSKSISIFPVKNYKESIAKWDSYALLACQYGFDEIFSSLHLPELSIDEQLASLVEIGRIAQKYKMSLSIDIGGNYTSAILNDPKLLETIQQIKINYIRLDCNYSFDEVKRLYEQLDIDGFIINASIYNDKQLHQQMSFLNSLEGCQIKACHNFYPREETGLDKQFALRQDEMYHKYISDIYYFVCSQTSPRGPIYKGLPTIEYHRYMDVYSITKDLLETYHATSIMLADEFLSEEELRQINKALMEKREECYDIEVETINDKYDEIIFTTHSFRYDSNERFLRSESSRRMSEFAKRVPVENTVERVAGSITIDNELYKRYSGELQVVLLDSDRDERVNVIGKISKEDIEKLKLYRNGYHYRFVRKREN